MLDCTTVGGRGNTNLTPYKFGRQTVKRSQKQCDECGGLPSQLCMSHGNGPISLEFLAL